MGRFARLAAAGLRSGAGMLAGERAASAYAVEALGTLRGLAAKVGQMASYVDGLVPEEQRESYERAMAFLRERAPSSSPAEVRALVQEELGAPIERLFERWEERPFASASIGQVHRASLAGGLEVAVKVQHPGVARAVESDLANAAMLEGLAAALGARKFDTKTMLDVVRARFREELDYELEAERMRHFARVHAGDRAIRVPAVVGSHSARRVLTTELAHGRNFEEACAARPAERRAWAETLWRFVFKGNLIGGKFNADPHPGNYLFQDGGRVVFLDYGCVQELSVAQRASIAETHRAALDRDEAAFARALARMVGAKPGRLEARAVAYGRSCFEPLFASPYRITRGYVAGLVTAMKEMAVFARTLDDREFFTLPPDWLFTNRLQFGFYSVLARLDVEVDYGSLEREFLPLQRAAAAVL